MGLVCRTACGSVYARELKQAPAVVAAAGVELRGMVREGERESGAFSLPRVHDIQIYQKRRDDRRIKHVEESRKVQGND
jgi:ATP sulfurylase